jgi:lysophospholipase L1-like esterase
MVDVCGRGTWLSLALAFAACSGRPIAATAPETATQAPTPADTSRPAGPLEQVHFLGRFTDDTAGPRFGYPGSAIATRFRGTAIDVTLDDTGHSRFDVSVDGGAPTLLVTGGGTTVFTLTRELAPGEHAILLVKRTESFEGVVRFGGFRVANGGALVPTPFPFTRRIEMIGDSITCGYGDLGASKDCRYSAETSNENVAWGALAARQLGAMHTAIAYSGRAVFKNRDGGHDDKMDAVWLRTLPDEPSAVWDFARYVPDLVVINLGTNDFAHGDPGAGFVPAYTALVQGVRRMYAATRIVCAVGPMLEPPLHDVLVGHVQRAIAATHDPRVTFLELPPADRRTELGCDYHPNR